MGERVAQALFSATGGNGALTYMLLPALPTGLEFGPSRHNISGTPTAPSARRRCNYTATDEDGDTASLAGFITVEGLSANAGLDQIVPKGAIVTLDGSGSSTVSSGSGTLTYDWAPHPDNGFTVTLNGADTVNPRFTVPANPSADSLQFNLTVSNGSETPEPSTVEIRIRPFIQGSVAEQAYTTGVPITPLVLPNALGNAKSYSLTPPVPGLTFNPDPDIRTLSGTPITAGIYDLTYTVTSNGTNTDTLSFRVNVNNSNNSNNAPTITGTPDTTVAEDTPYSFTPGGGDGDVGDTLVYSITATPSWATFSTTTGALTGTPTSADAGTTTTGIVISVTDNNIATPVSLPAFNLAVTNVNDGPTGPQLSAESLTMLISETREITISGGIPPYTVDFVSGDRAAMQTVVDGATLRVTGVGVGQAMLRIRDLIGGFSILEVEVNLPTLPLLNPEVNGGSATAVFRGGASSDGSNYFKDGAFSVGETLDIAFVITPRAFDVGAQANVVIVARMGSDPWFQLLAPSGPLPYDGETLTFFIEGLALKANNFIDITPEPVTLTAGLAGNFELYVGYQLGNGELFYHPLPLKIEVVE